MTAISTPRPQTGGRTPLITAAWIVTAACLVAGAIGLVLRFTLGHAGADYGSYVPWGLWIAAYVALIGASAGAFAFAALIFFRRQTEDYHIARLAMLVAFGAFAAGMLNVWLDLGHPLRAWKLMTQTSFGSIMGWMSWFYVVYGIVLVVGLFLNRKGTVHPVVERFAWVAFLFAVVFAGAEGALFGVVGARELWESGMTPVLFLAEAALFGIGLVVAAAAVFGLLDPATARRLGAVLLVLIGIMLVLEWAEFSTGLLAGTPAKAEALRTILFGPFWWVFWFFHLLLGAVVPAVLLLFRRGSVVATGVAGALIAAMGIATKLNLVLPVLAQEELEGLAEAFTGPGLVFEYFPTVMEWLVWLGTLGLAGLIVLVGARLTRITEPANVEIAEGTT
jgi:protein NrfD